MFGLTLGALIVGAGASQAAPPVLPTGGRLQAGQAVIGAPSGGVLTVTQSSGKAILDWSSFSIGQDGAVRFDNGSGATLNRVTGAGVSSINGLLSGTGSVYVINPNGVIVGKSGVVSVGGTFVASTLDTPDASFLTGGAMNFTGSSHGAVINLGKVGALGGDVALIAARVENEGSLTAANGTAGLISGYSVTLHDSTLDDGKFSVLLGGAGTSVTNAGLIQAANAELRAEGGNVYALAGDTAGVIRATGVKSGGGKVWLVADGGELDLAGELTAQGPGGAGGAIETSGGTVKVGNARIDAHGGRWLVDPYDLTIDATAATTIDNALNAGTSVTEQTSANGYSGVGVASASGQGDITVAAPITWSTSAGLTLSAYRNIAINAQVTASGGGALTLVTDNSGSGNGGTLLFNGGSVQFTEVSGGQPAGALAIGVGTAAPLTYQLVADLHTLSADITANNAGNFALASSVDGSNAATGYTDSPLQGGSTTAFNGALEGLGNSIINLTIVGDGFSDLGLFNVLGANGRVSNLNLTGGHISFPFGSGLLAGALVAQNYGLIKNVSVSVDINGGTEGTIGDLVGGNGGKIINSFVSGTVTGSQAGGVAGYNGGEIAAVQSESAVSGNISGGLVGSNGGTIRSSYSVGSTTGGESGGLVGSNSGSLLGVYSSSAVRGTSSAGGLVGANVSGTIQNAYATGFVTGVSNVGGLVGENSYGSIQNAYASGKVSGLTETGGLVGLNYQGKGTVTGAFYDVNSTGLTSDGAGAVGLTTAQFLNASGPISGLGLGTAAGGASFVIIDADGTLNGSNGATRPILLSEYSTTITNAHQLQLIALAPSANYILASSIDASGTAGVSDVWGPSGFVPIGLGSSPFTGSLNGQGLIVTNLTISRPGNTSAGLFGAVSGRLSNLGLIGEQVVGGGAAQSAIGGLAATLDASGSITNAFAMVTLSSGGGGPSGGLVGLNDGNIVASYASGSVNSVSFNGGEVIGGLVGMNAGSISTSYSNAVVTGAIPMGAGRVVSAGGLVGDNTGSLANVYATGAVTSSVSGGLVAINYGGSITNAYATGLVSAASPLSGDDQGGLAAVNTGAISGAYYDKGATGQAVGVGSNGGAPVSQTGVTAIGGDTGLSPYQASTYTNFSFGGLGSGAAWVTGDFFEGSSGATRPLLLSEYSTTISNAHQLQLIALNLSANYTLATDIDATGTSNRSDIWGSQGFIPLGSGYLDANLQPQAQFSGSLNGAFHTVSGVMIDGSEFVGLFGYIGSTGLVSDLTLSGGFVRGFEAVGALAGENDGAVIGVSASATVSFETGTDNNGYAAGGDLIGGLVGINTGTIDRSSASGTVAGLSEIGGLVGGDYADPGAGLIENSHASGSVTEIGGGDAGGLVGQIATNAVKTPSLINSYATGAVSAAATTYSNLAPSYFAGVADVGGLIGYIGHVQTTSIVNDYATGAVSGLNQVGGLVGGMRPASVDYPAGVTIQNSYATGSVTGASQVGGLTGFNEAAIVGSYATGNVNGASGKATDLGGLVGVNDGQITASFASGSLQGDSDVGGLVGINNGAISGSFATGAIIAGSGQTVVRSGQIVGGLVGFNSGTITESYATGAATGDQIVGGLVGFNGGTISNSYALGQVAGASGKGTPSGSGALIGGLVGESIGSVTTSYASGAVSGTGQIGGLVGLNGASASIVASYATGGVSGSSGKTSQAGGLVGVNYGLLSQDYATGQVVAHDQIGGLAGYNDGQIADTYATGAVSGASGKGGLVGVNDQGATVATSYATGKGGYGFAGANSGGFSSDVFDSGTAGTNTGVGSGSGAGLTAIGGSTGLSSDSASSYAGFDFANVWTINPGSSRPYLLAAPQSPPPS